MATTATDEATTTVLDTVKAANTLAVHIASAKATGTIIARSPEVYTGHETGMAVSYLLDLLNSDTDRLIKVTVEWEHTTKNGNWYSPTLTFLGA